MSNEPKSTRDQLKESLARVMLGMLQSGDQLKGDQLREIRQLIKDMRAEEAGGNDDPLSKLAEWAEKNGMPMPKPVADDEVDDD